MKQSASQLAQRILDEQGHVVIRTVNQCEIGPVLAQLNIPGTNEGALQPATTVIVGVATFEEYLEQHRRFAPGGLPLPTNLGQHYYRVIVE
jgi:hypothetical protein